MAKTPVIKAEGLSRVFKTGKSEVTALKPVNFEIFSGELICIFGPSGCGKSTLLSLLAGLQPPSEGKVFIRGEDLSSFSNKNLAKYRRNKIGMVFQQFNLISSMSVLDNIALPMAFGKIPKKQRLKRAEYLLEAIDLKEKKNEPITDLSGGQQQRIAIARSLVNNPWIIFADEPTGNLDSRSSDDVMKLLISLSRKSKRTIVLISHNPAYLQYSDRIFYMKDGKIEKIEVRANPVKIELLNTVSMLDKIRESKDPIEAGTAFENEINKLEKEKREWKKERKK